MTTSKIAKAAGGLRVWPLMGLEAAVSGSFLDNASVVLTWLLGSRHHLKVPKVRLLKAGVCCSPQVQRGETKDAVMP